jgi:hypothetical protein
MKNILITIIIGLFLFTTALSQNSAQVKNQIELSLLSYVNGKYKLAGDEVFGIDSVSQTRRPGFQKVLDSYGTLKGCYLFVAETGIEDHQKYSIGVFKNNTILWISDSLYEEYYVGKFEAVFDINKDGYVEIVTNWRQLTNNIDSDIWVFSWDGSRGWVINDVDKEGRTVMNTYCMLKDINGDGIYELVSKEPVYDQYGNRISWKEFAFIWNGSKYVPGYDILEKKTTVANNLTASLHTIVTKNLDTLGYKFLMSNNLTSVQPVKYLFISDSPTSVKGITPNGWEYTHKTNPSLSCFIALNRNALEKGQSIDSLIITSKGLPKISNCYVQAPYSFINYHVADTSIIERVINENIISNSFVSKTIAPTDPPNPFVPLNFLDTLSSYTTQSRTLGWIKDQTTTDKYLGYFNSAKISLQQNNISSTRSTLNQVLQDAIVDTSANITSEAYALIRFNTEYLLVQLPTAPVAGCNIKLVNSTGAKLTGGTLQYYDSAWKDAVNNNDGTFFVNTTKTSLSLRMTYEYGTQTKSNVAVGYDTIAFQTVNAQIQLQNSNGILMDTGSVQYYSGAWRTFGTTNKGTTNKELLPNNYSFRMTYAYASKDKQQDIGTNPIVVFQTVNAGVQLQNSQGSLIDQGTVQYYSGAWRTFGTTNNGTTNKELLPNNYSFRMTYEYASKDKQQDLSTNPAVIFQTVNAAVQLQNSQGALVDQGTVQYYSGAWRAFGTTNNGTTNKELLPNNYSFRMTYEYASKDKQQDLSTNPTVIFQTVNAAVQLQNSQGALIDQGTVQYYSGAWRTFGTTNNGTTNKELLPNNYSFRMTYEYASKDKQQDLNTNPTVVFQTVNAQVQLKNSQGSLIDQGTVQYYAGAWRTLGTTTNGTASKELLPNNYSFRMTYEYVSVDKQQDLSSNNMVGFSTVLCTIRVKNSQDQLVDNAFASYYSGAWRQIGKTVNGEIAKELLPVNLSFRAKYGTQQQDKQQNLSTNNVVEFGIQ